MNAPLFLTGSLSARAILATGVAASLALLGGCAGSSSLKSASAKPNKATAATDKSVARAEQAVEQAPKDAALRAALGQTYLAAGRFQSAATAFNDAMSLGDNGARTALGLGLALIGSGHQRDAVALLDDWRSDIPAADLGLALALAGETGRGVAILSDAVRSGASTPKLRQNLAYAYALDGRWAEARLMAAQDVPAAELDKRIAMWTLSALPDRNQDRVAGLIGAPVRSDPGQPAMLALNTDPVEQQLAAQSVPEAAPAPAFAANDAPAPSEAPAVYSNLTAQQEPVAEAPRPALAAAFAGMAPKPARAAKVAAPRPKLAAGGSHLVQLGAFSSPQGARRSWGIFVARTPSLKSYRMTITAANVHGKAVWRVAAAGLNGRDAASGLCSRVKSSGGACFAYSGPVRGVPQKLMPGRDTAGTQRARR